MAGVSAEQEPCVAVGFGKAGVLQARVSPALCVCVPATLLRVLTRPTFSHHAFLIVA